MSVAAGVIPFYGGEYPHLFAIERRCMDRDGKVIAHLDAVLPAGVVLDIGAGNGWTARRLHTAQRSIVPLEPDRRMLDPTVPLPWVVGVAQRLPFADHTFAAAYATWAFFFDGIADVEDGLREVERVVVAGGLMIVVDNAGDDEFCALSPHPISSDRTWWESRGWTTTIIETAFRFDTLAEANELLTFYFGPAVGQSNRKTELHYRVAVYQRRAR